jgi:hypothetical protein
MLNARTCRSFGLGDAPPGGPKSPRDRQEQPHSSITPANSTPDANSGASRNSTQTSAGKGAPLQLQQSMRGFLYRRMKNCNRQHNNKHFQTKFPFIQPIEKNNSQTTR